MASDTDDGRKVEDRRRQGSGATGQGAAQEKTGGPDQKG